MSLVQAGLQLIEVWHLRILWKTIKRMIPLHGGDFVWILFNMIEIILEPLYPFWGYILESGGFGTVCFKVPEAASPVTPVPLWFGIPMPCSNHSTVIGEERRVDAIIVNQKLSAEYFLFSLDADSLSLEHCFSVLVFLCSILCIHECQTKRFSNSLAVFDIIQI